MWEPGPSRYVIYLGFETSPDRLVRGDTNPLTVRPVDEELCIFRRKFNDASEGEHVYLGPFCVIFDSPVATLRDVERNDGLHLPVPRPWRSGI